MLAALTLVAGSLAGIAVPLRAAADGNEAPGNPPAFRAITAGDSHSCAILASGAVKCWGAGSSGRLGLGDTSARGDQTSEMGDNLPAVALGTGRTATAITAGLAHTCVLLDNATVKCWGYNVNGQLGLGDTLSRGDGPGEMGDGLPAVELGTGRTATAITANLMQTCALLDNGDVKCWGRNTYGALGTGDTNDRGDDPGEMGDGLPPVPLGTGRTATAITAGEFHTCALLDNATVKCWGYNEHGELGIGNIQNRGDGPGEMGDNLATVDLGTGRTATAITAGRFHTCALLDNATVKCWGFNGSGELGLGTHLDNRGNAAGEMGDNLPALDLGTGRTVTAITAGEYDTCARLDNATVKCWGQNSFGQLGLGTTWEFGGDPGEMGDNLPAVDLGTGRTVIAVTAGRAHNCARLDDASIKCWGQSTSGQLGLRDTFHRGNQAGEMGDNLPPVTLVGPPDVTAPTVTITTPPDAATYTRGQVVNADYSCTDPPGGSGLYRCFGPVGNGQPVNTATLGQRSFAVTGTDRVGNAITVTSTYTVIDGTDPTAAIATPPDDATYTRGQVVNADYSCTDDAGGSGIDTCTGDVADGAAIDTSTLGAHTFSVTATDNDGNDSTVVHDYTVVPPTCIGFPATVDLRYGETPTAGSDVITGTTGNDVVDGLGGQDLVCALAGTDTVRGGLGDDFLLGGAGMDRLFGGANNDLLHGGPGNDYGDGGPGSDQCALAPGTDTTVNCEA